MGWRAARKGKRDRAADAGFEFNLEPNLWQLQQELREQAYETGTYTNFYIYEPKRRLVSAAPFRDRVVHHALCQVIEPIWLTGDESFHHVMSTLISRKLLFLLATLQVDANLPIPSDDGPD